MKSTIITHTKPHLDEIMAVWLIRRYFAGFSRACVKFISAENGGADKINPDQDPKTLYIGVGRGKFDEHRGLVANCTSSLVWRDIKSSKQKVISSKLEIKAVDRMVEYVLREDTGKLVEMADRTFSVQNILWGYYDNHQKSSKKMVEFGQTIVDALFAQQLTLADLEQAWKKKKIFQTKWGKAVALEADEKGLSGLAFQKGYELIIGVNHKNGYHGFRAKAQGKVDLTEIYQKIKETEPEADWFLHQSKKLLLCGGDVAPKARKSKLRLEEMIELVKK